MVENTFVFDRPTDRQTHRPIDPKTYGPIDPKTP